MPIVVTPGKIRHVDIFGALTGAIAETKVSNAEGSIITYAWSTLEGSSTVPDPTSLSAKNGLGAGVYQLLVRDADEIITTSFVIKQNKQLKIYPGTVQHINVFGRNTGIIERSMVAGGNGTYTPYWMSNVLDMSADHSLQRKEQLYAGRYTLRIVD